MKIGVWYHGVLSGPRIHHPEWAAQVMAEQMNAIKESGLSAAADEIHVRINGDSNDQLEAAMLCPFPADIRPNGPQAASELSTLACLQRWLQPGWAVLYHHIKGVQFPGDGPWSRWRRCMTRACVWNWKQCLEEIVSGADSVGAHWLTHSKYPMVNAKRPIWGGNFWWATSDFLLTLPEVTMDSWEKRYDAEVWISSGRRYPRTVDLAQHWPMTCKA